MSTLWLDFETYSECDLSAHGTHRYAEHPSTEITVAQWAWGDDDPIVVDCTGPIDDWAVLEGLKYRLESDPTVTVVAHNSAFDRTLLRHCWGIDVPIKRWRDTMIQAMSHGLPGALDKIGTIMGVGADEAKDKRGRELIRMFCKPQPRSGARYTSHTHPQAWEEFLEYSRQDIVAMRAIHHRLPKWNMRDGGTELALWHLDQRINDRGFQADLELAAAAIDAVGHEQARLKQEVHDLTDGEVTSPSKRDDLLVHILMEYGVALPDMKADTLRRRMEDPELPEGVRLLLALRLEATKTSTAKYKSLVNACSADGRMRNTLQFCGAQRTGRWAGRTFQPQNMPRPSMDADEIDVGIEALKMGVADQFFDDVMDLTSNTVRGCIIAPPGRKLVVADLSNIEGRGLAYLAGEEWKLEAFRVYDTFKLDEHGQRIPDGKGDWVRMGPDLYKVAYARAFGVDANFDHKTVQGHMQRQIGKVQELGLGYEGGVAAFLTFAAVYRMDLAVMADAVHGTAPKEALAAAYGMWEWAEKKRRTLGLERNIYVACEVLKKAWRDAHPATVSLWSEVGDAVRRAILNPGECFTVRQLKFQRDGAWLRIRLPSGRYLCYIKPEVDEGGQITYWGVNQYTRQWGKIKTYGGKLVENIVQAWARDVLAYRMREIELAGFDIVLTVHDELITEADDNPARSVDDLVDFMADPPPWADGCPLAAAGFETYRYRKD